MGGFYSQRAKSIQFITPASEPVRSQMVETVAKLAAEEEKTRRVSLLVTGALVGIAVLVPVFAPQGRETLSYWLGATLFVFAAGTAGFTRVWAKTPKIELLADDGATNSNRVSDS